MNTTTPVRILLVEDDEDDCMIFKDYLADLPMKYEIAWAKNNAEFQDQLEKNEFDIIVTDYLLGTTSGLEVLKRAREKSPHTPVIILTGKGSDSIDIEAMKLGAADYLIKSQLDAASIERSIRYALERANASRILVENENYQNRLDKIISTGRIARMIAHEIKNPLTSITLCVDQLKDLVGSNEEAAFYINIINQTSSRIDQLVNDLINSTRFGDIKLQKENLVDVVKNSLQLAADRARLKSVQLQEEYSDPTIEMELDGEKLKLAFVNLIVNAVEATEEKTGVIGVRVRKQKDKVSVCIKDNGCGMTPEVQKKLFEPFFTSKAKGSGLGLTSAHNIILGHKGRIDVTSEPGKGTEFVVSFPLG